MQLDSYKTELHINDKYCMKNKTLISTKNTIKSIKCISNTFNYITWHAHTYMCADTQKEE